jgi:hypothetical protein
VGESAGRRRLRRRIARAALARVLVWCIGGAGVAADSARGQDFAGAASPALDGEAFDGAFTLLEYALPPANPAFAAAAAHTRWWSSPELETRAAALGGAWRTLRASIGVSQTGVPELGWTALAGAAGRATSEMGAAVRACARLDRDEPWGVTRAVSRAAGVEAGAGAWLAPAAGVRVWAAAPQLYTHGSSPPLARALELGVRAGGESGAWLRLRAPHAGDDGERAMGVAIAVAPAIVWAEVRDAPLRGAAGVRLPAGPLRIEARVDEHPVLGETVRVALAWRRKSRGAS